MFRWMMLFLAMAPAITQAGTRIGQTSVDSLMLTYRNPQTGTDLDASQTRVLIEQLYASELLNLDEVLAAQKLDASGAQGDGFSVINPYYPRAEAGDVPLPSARSVMQNGGLIQNPEQYPQPAEGYEMVDGEPAFYQQAAVSRWFSELRNGGAAAEEVCAVAMDADGRRYRLKTFPTVDAALQAGWQITHQYRCGSCSSLRDLAAYIAIPDMTQPVRACSQRGRGQLSKLDEVKQCIIEAVGFTPACAESWAYNAVHTGAECAGRCMRSYGRAGPLPALLQGGINILRGQYSACPASVESEDAATREVLEARGCPLDNEQTGKLNDCLWCDEQLSGPGFKYSAARTRRASGLPSAIPRPNDRLFYEADHSRYFSGRAVSPASGSQP